MSIVIQNLVSFTGIMLIALFVENAVFARGMGVSRLVNLMSDSRVDRLIFCSLVTLILVISAPLTYFSSKIIAKPSIWFREYIRPLILVVCTIIVFIVILFLVFLIKPTNMKNILTALPMAAFNSAVLGPLLITSTQNYTFVQTMGFALGSGLGYGFALLLLSEGQRKINNKNIPQAFKGLPISLIYIGILALAIYGLIGHSVVI